MPDRSTPAALAAACALGLAPAVSHAVDLDWDATGALLFYDTAGNWNPAQAPTAADNVTFAIDVAGSPIIIGASSVALNVDISDFDWEFTGAAGGVLNSGGTVTIDDLSGTTLANGTNLTTTDNLNWDNVGNIIVADQGFGGLTVASGSDLRGSDVFVGNLLGSVGEVTVDGAGSTLITDGTVDSDGFFIGNNGTGTLNVTNGGLARILNDTSGSIANFILGNTATGDGTLNIDGAGSQAIGEDSLIGNLGTGTLNITNGGEFLQNISTSPDAFVGSGAGGTGSVTVNGDGSRWLSSRTEIGNAGAGTLSVEAGGLVQSGTSVVDDMIIGDQTGSTGSVAVFGSEAGNASRLESGRDLYVGNLGLGELRVGQDLTGSTATSGGNGELSVASDLRIGFNVANTLDNKVILDGANVTATVGDVIYAGENGTGTLEVRNGATVTNARTRVGSGVDSDGTLLVTGTGSTFTATNDFLVATNGTGVATVSDGATLNNFGFFWVGYQSNADGTLTIDNATVNAQTGNLEDFIIGGRTDGSGGTGLVTVQNGGRLNVANEGYIGGNTTGSGRLVVTGVGSVYDHEDGSVNDFLRIGHTGEGFAEVRDGGEMIAEGIEIGNGSGSAAADLLVTGNNGGTASTLSTNGFLRVGNTRAGTMTVSDGAQINIAVNPGTDAANKRLIVGNGANADGSRLTVTGAGTRIDYFSNERLSVGFNGGSTSNRALLEILDGAVVQLAQPGEALADQGFIVVGDESGGNGQIDVDGAGSLLEGRYLNIGESTNTSGLVNLTNGGQIKANDFSEVGAAGTGDSFMNISGSGSVFDVGTDDPANSVFQGDLSVGAGGVGTNGTLNIFDGGTARNVRTGYVGRVSGSNGTLNLGDQNVGDDGALATWEVGQDLYIAGSSNLAVSGSQTSGSGTVNLNENGLLDVTGQTVIKDRGTVNLNGGELATDTLLFQDFAERTGSPTLNFNSGTLRFTQSGGNTLDSALLSNIFNGGPQELTAGQHLAVDGTTVFGDGIRVNGGELSIGAISAANFQNVDFDAGTLNFTNSGIVVTAAGLFGSTLTIDDDQAVNASNSLFVQADGLLNVSRGSVSASAAVNSGTTIIAEGDATFTGGLTNNGDLILIDATLNGTLTNNGDLTVVDTTAMEALALGSGGSVSFEVASLVGGPDLLDVTGAASIDGALTVTADDPNALTLGTEFDLITAAGGVSGTFSSLVLPTLSGGLGLDVLYEANRVALAVVNVGALAGDYDDDGLVGQGDLDLVLLNWGDDASVTGVPAGWVNFQPGGLIGQAELDGVLLNWGNTAEASGSAVPEPGVAGLLLLGGLMLRRRWA